MNAMRRQQGFFLLEALVAILIFSLGVLGMIAMGGAAIAGQSDAQVRTEAAALAAELAGQIALNVDRTGETQLAASLPRFEHQGTIAAGSYCTFTGAASADPIILAWQAKVVGAGGLPGAAAAFQSVHVDTTATGYNSVQISMCWQAPNDTGKRRYVTTVYVNL